MQITYFFLSDTYNIELGHMTCFTHWDTIKQGGNGSLNYGCTIGPVFCNPIFSHENTMP